jgi:hypothetical protein
MGVAGNMASANSDKETLCKELEEVCIEIKNLEKRKDWLKAKVDPLLAPKERVGLVEKVEVRELAIDEDLLASLEKRFGSAIVRRECNKKLLREKMEADTELDKSIPRGAPKYQIRVGEKFGA